MTLTLEVTKLILALAVLWLTIAVYRNWDSLSAPRLRSGRALGITMVLLSALAILRGPVTALSVGETGVRLALELAYGFVFAAVLVLHAVRLRRVNTRLKSLRKACQ